MIKKLLFLGVVMVLLITFLSKERIEKKVVTSKLDYSSLNIPYLNNNFVAFKEALAFKESQGNYSTVNSLGYLGKYQFGKTTLERFKIYDSDVFLKDPELQERTFKALCSVNKWILRRDMKRYVGKVISGIQITESGILAAAHLSGAGNVKKFLRSNGKETFQDAYGASIQMYMEKFAGYDVSNILANRKAKVIS